MKRKDNQDERIQLQRRKIQSDAYAILIYCLIISILVQQFILRAPFTQFAGEFLCLCAIGVYTTFRHITSGINIWTPDETRFNFKKLIFNSIFSGLTCTILMIFLTGQSDMKNILSFLITFTIAFSIPNLFLSKLIRWKQAQITKELDTLEEDDD